MADSSSHIDWFRHTGPYIRSHRGKTFVVYLGNGALESRQFANLIHDLALLHLLGVRLILVHATRNAIDASLARRNIEGSLEDGIRVTDGAVLDVVREVIGTQRLLLERRLSMGLPDSPMQGAQLRVFSGNFITGRPLGVVNGVDFQFTGTVRRVDAAGIASALDTQAIVLLSPLGFSPTGEVFNLSSDEVAAASAIAVGADKLIIMDDQQGLVDETGQLVRQCTVEDARHLVSQGPNQRAHIEAACMACEHGVHRTHLLSFHRDGALIDELFTHDGVGTLISQDSYERYRVATVDDIAGVLELVAPLEAAGVLVRRSRERLEQEIGNFRVLNRDGRIIACAALYPFPDANMAEIACIATDPDYRSAGRGGHLLQLLEQEAASAGVASLFVLTTQTKHWFQEQGFVEQGLDTLPAERQGLYNLQRNSKVLVKPIP